MKEIALTQGLVALVDDDSFIELSRYKWYAMRNKNTYYAVRNTGKFPLQSKVSMHIQIMNPPKGMLTDHRDGNGLNNQRSNLRICTHLDNVHNRAKHKNNQSGYRGVTRDGTKWRATISINGKKKQIGRYDTKEQAACAYDEAIKDLHGDFARTNF